jgi:hypothetical protein
VGDKERYRQAGADTEATNGLGQTALHIAAARGELNICRALLRAGAGADRRAADGSVALAVAAAAGQAGAVRRRCVSATLQFVSVGCGRLRQCGRRLARRSTRWMAEAAARWLQQSVGGW